MKTDKAPIFNIVHGSFVDGYGIRTTVFLKGCPLRCVWCCNPEGQKSIPELKVSEEKCDGCLKCLPLCPENAIKVDETEDGVQLTVDRNICTDCGDCVDVCYTGALEMFGEEYTVDELYRIIEKDQHYYRSSGGGVTIGGGEATVFASFTLALIRKCKENYIHTAIDTCGCTMSEEGLKCLEEADLLLFDLKDLDEARHIENTGISNTVILDNLKHLSAIGKPMIIRIPVITGYNDMEENLNAMAEFISSLRSVERVDLIPVHEFGKIKYAQLDMKYRLKADPIPPERQEQIRALFESYGMKTQIGG